MRDGDEGPRRGDYDENGKRRSGRFDRVPRPNHGRITREEVMSSEEVAVLIEVKRKTVEEWARRKRIPSRKRGRRRIFLRWEVEDWLIAEDED